MNGLEETKQAVKYLKAARKLITPEGSWCKGYYARDAARSIVQDYALACSFCSAGAMESTLGVPMGSAWPKAEFELLDHAFDGSISANNDTPSTKHLHVLMAYDFAILHAEDEVKRLRKLEKL